MRKTVKIADIIKMVNDRNKKSTCNPEIRQGWNSLLETILHENEVYQGYSYLHGYMIPKGEKPGISQDEHGNSIFPDDSRREYYIDRRLQGE